MLSRSKLFFVCRPVWTYLLAAGTVRLGTLVWVGGKFDSSTSIQNGDGREINPPTPPT